MILLLAGRKQLNRVRVVQECLDRSRERVYLEIGVEHGLSFTGIIAQCKIAVDPRIKMTGIQRKICERNSWEAHYFEMTSDDFFATQSELLERKGISVALIDGLHTYEQALRDVENTLRYLHEDGAIVLHDCNPVSARVGYPAASYAEFKQSTPWTWYNPASWRWSGDVWKAIVRLRSDRHDLQVAVLDCDCGVGLVRRGGKPYPLSLTPGEIDALTYDDLARDRKGLLNLQPPEAFAELLA